MKRALLAVLLTLLVVSIPSVTQPDEVTTLKPHEPIYINGNEDFTPQNGVVGGSGTEDDPYIIGGWEINVHGIWIENTDAFFIIGYCKVSGGVSDDGIVFNNVRNGEILRCELLNSQWGIFLLNSSANKVFECTIQFNFGGIVLVGSSDNQLFKNNVNSNEFHGISLRDYSLKNEISENVIRDNGYCGLAMDCAENNEVRGNIIVNNARMGIGLDASPNNCFYHNNIDNREENVGVDTMSHSQESLNQWDNGFEGNYWGGYSGWDDNGDGISDIPYRIESGGTDRYPLMRPWRPNVVAMGIKFTGPDELVTIRNWSEKDVDLTGWQLQSVNLETQEVEHTFSFAEGCILPADGRLRVHSGPEAGGKENEPCGTPEFDLYRGWLNLEEGSTVWDDLGGIVRLVNDQDEVVDEHKYHWWMGG